MFKKILICNRGEIALRINRTCHDMGIKTVQIYSKADADSRPVELADEAVLIGPAPSSRSYLHIPSIIHVCRMTGAEAVHPGYGFLSQDTYFAEICQDSGITFIGPSPKVMEMMGDKSSARKLMLDAGLPLPGGTEKPLVNYDEARDRSEEVGYPIILKASAGGGGRGMQVVWDRSELAMALENVRNTAQSVFKDNRVYLEKFIRDARHVELQVMGDRQGNVVYLGERDCSIQRRQQKLIEESPSTYINDDLRQRMGEAAVAAAKAIGYESAGDNGVPGRFRSELLLHGDEYAHSGRTPGHRVCPGIGHCGAHDPGCCGRTAAGQAGGHQSARARDRMSGQCGRSCKRLERSQRHGYALYFPPASPVRVDTHAHSGYTIPPYYDSLLAKVIVCGRDRTEALNVMQRALREFACEGVKTTIPFHLELLAHPVFRSGDYHLDFIEKYMTSEGTLTVPEALMIGRLA